VSESLRRDLVTREVILGWLDTAVEEMQNAIIKSAYSMLIAEGRDATAALFDEHGRTLAQASSIPVHLGVMVGLGRIISQRYPANDAKPGDIYITNDPYAGGTHMPDIAVCVPIFFDGDLVGYALTMAHHRDIGGLLPGSVSLKARDTHAEGLRIPLVRLVNNHVPCESIWDLITAGSRTPSSLRGDLSAQIAGCKTGERRLGELFRRWSPAIVREASASLMDYSERLTRQAIASLPRGRATFVDHLDDDGLNPDAAPTRIKVSVEVTNDEITFDFTGSGNSVAAAINNVAASTTAIVYYAVRALTGDSVPSNDGCYRPVRITLPKGSIVNAGYPAPVGSRGVALKRIEDVVLGALAKLAPEKMCAAHSGQYTIVSIAGRDHLRDEPLIGHMGGPYAGGNGAQPKRDGIDCSDHGATNGSMVSIEDSESRMPLRFRKLELWTDSGGAGCLRGGLGYEAEVEWLGGEITATLRRERIKFAPRGLQGGHDAPRCRTILKPLYGSPKELPGKIDFVMRSGDIVHYWTTGGAGRGSPRDRDQSKIIADVMDGRVSPEAARHVYGLNIEQLGET
jgi:N-methylhydantoinase B/oxoprolinase/acetone carboxylase alpha subunit